MEGEGGGKRFNQNSAAGSRSWEENLISHSLLLLLEAQARIIEFQLELAVGKKCRWICWIIYPGCWDDRVCVWVFASERADTWLGIDPTWATACLDRWSCWRGKVQNQPLISSHRSRPVLAVLIARESPGQEGVSSVRWEKWKINKLMFVSLLLLLLLSSIYQHGIFHPVERWRRKGQRESTTNQNCSRNCEKNVYLKTLPWRPVV